MAEERKAFLLRVDSLLWKEIEGWAADELRSVNGQIEFILREAMRHRRGSRSSAPDEAGGPSVPPAPAEGRP